MISADVKDMPEFFRQPQFDGNSMMCKKLNMLPIECIVRGYITGSGWASYQKDGTVCGIRLPEGLKESDKLPEPIYTPSTLSLIHIFRIAPSYPSVGELSQAMDILILCVKLAYIENKLGIQPK